MRVQGRKRGTRTGGVGTLAAVALVTAATLLAPSAVEAQGRGGKGGIPPGHMPPPGACRVWYHGRPPGHQPRPTSCAVARRQAARTGGRVIYGGDPRGRYERGQYERGRYERDRYGDGRWKRDRWDDRWDDRHADRRDCDAKDRRKGRCDDRYGEDRYGDRHGDDRRHDGRSAERPSRGGTRPDIWDVILDRNRR